MKDSPYVGLNSFGIADAEYFFGREVESRTLEDNLCSSRLTLLYGPTGVGKTSLLTAGMMSNLERASRRNVERREGKPGFLPVMFRAWQADPSAGIYDAVRQQAVAMLSEEVRESLSAASDLDTLFKQWTAADMGDLLLVLDQFELYFVHHDAFRDPFTDVLARCLASPSLAVNVLISIREDWLPSLDTFKSLIPALFENYLRLAPLSREGATAAIRRPIEQYNAKHGTSITIEDGLVEEVLERSRVRAPSPGAELEPFEAAAFQIILERLWNEERPNSKVLRSATLRRLTKRRDIIDQYVRETLGRLGFFERRVASKLVDELVTPVGTKTAQTLGSLAGSAHRSRKRVKSIIERLMPLLSNVAPPRGIQDSCYEISHDVIAPALARWQAARQQRRRWGIVAAVFAVVAAAGGALSVFQHQRKVAAVVGSLLSQSDGILRNRPADLDLGLLLAIEAMRLDPSSAAEASLRNAANLLPLPLMRVRFDAPVRQVVFSRDGKRFGVRTGRIVAVIQSRDGQVLSALSHDAVVNSFALNRDGTMVLTGAADGKVRLWRTGSSTPQWTMTHTDAVNAVAFAPDGSIVATGSDDRTVRLWETTSGRPIPTNFKHNGCVFQLAFNPDGTFLLSTGDDGGVRIWGIKESHAMGKLGTQVFTSIRVYGSFVVAGGEHGLCLWQISQKQSLPIGKCVDAPASSIDLSDSFASADANLFRWRAERSRTDIGILEHSRVKVSHPGWIRASRVIHYGSFITGGDDGTARVWTSSFDGAIHEVLVFPHRGPVMSLDWDSPDEELDPHVEHVVTGSADGTATMWQFPTPFGSRNLLLPSPVRVSDWGRGDSAVAPNGKRIVWIDKDGVHVADAPFTTTHILPGGDFPSVIPGGPGGWIRRGDFPSAIAVGPDGSIAAENGGQLRVWWSADANRPSDLNQPEAALSLAFIGRDLATASESHVRIWRHGIGTATELPSITGKIRHLDASPDGFFLLAGTSDHRLHIWNRGQGAETWNSAIEAGYPSALDISADSRRLAVCNGGRTVAIFPLSSAGSLQTDRLMAPCQSVAFNPTGRVLAVGMQMLSLEDDRSEIGIALADSTGKVTAILPTDATVVSIAFSKDGRRLAAGLQDGRLEVWDLASKQKLSSILDAGYSNRIAFSDDGRFLIEYGDELSIQALAPSDLIEQACELVKRNLSVDERRKYLPGISWTPPCRTTLDPVYIPRQLDSNLAYN